MLVVIHAVVRELKSRVRRVWDVFNELFWVVLSCAVFVQINLKDLKT